METIKGALETRQVTIYFLAVIAGAALGLTLPGARSFEPLINPALALMLFAHLYASAADGNRQRITQCPLYGRPGSGELHRDTDHCRQFDPVSARLADASSGCAVRPARAAGRQAGCTSGTPGYLIRQSGFVLGLIPELAGDFATGVCGTRRCSCAASRDPDVNHC